MTLPGGTVTFLLTDVEDSARAWQERPDETAKAVADIEGIVGEVVTAHDGHVVKSRGEGDSMFCVFPSATRAVVAAAEIQLALRAKPLRTRIALHTGEAELRDGDYYGVAPSKCARLRGVGSGGQILCSAATTAVAAGLPIPLSLRDLGSVRLRSFVQPERVSQVCHPELPADFPRIDAHETLPAPLTSFVGREHERESVLDALARARLVTLTGAGGSGKSRLAVEVARDLSDYPGGVWFVDLSPLADPDEIIGHIAEVLALPASTDAEGAVTERLAAAKTLLMLDNCEHLVDDVARLCDRVLQRCRALTLIATTREPLGVAGEVVLRVPSLDDDESISLFIARAGDNIAAPDAPATRAAIADICRRLDGIPLAIELAAARTHALALEDIASGLDDRFALLTSSGRTALSRQRTLEASVDWSYELLDAQEQALLRRLSTFVGSFSLDGAKAVASGIDSAVDTLTSLVAKSLVVPVDVLDLPRYRLLDTIRYYANRKLIDAGELDSTLDAHARYYLDLGTTLGEAFWSERQAWAMKNMVAELANTRAAADHELARGDKDAALAIAGSAWVTALDPVLEQAAWLRRLLDQTEGASADARFGAYNYLASLQINTGDFPGFVQLMREAGGLEDQLTNGPAKVIYRWLYGMKVALRSFPDARVHFDETEQLAQQHGAELSAVHYLRGMSEATMGDVVEGMRYLKMAAQLCRGRGHDLVELMAVGVAARASMHAGRLDDATALATEADELGASFPFAYSAPADHVQLMLPVLRGDADGARAAIRAVAAGTDADYYQLRAHVAQAGIRLGLLVGDTAEVRKHLDVSDQLFAAGFTHDRVEALLVHDDLEGAEKVVSTWEPLFTLAQESGTALMFFASVRLGRARVAMASKAYEIAASAARDALVAIDRCHALLGGPDALRLLGVALYELGDAERGVRLAAAGTAMAREMGLVLPPTRPSVAALEAHADDWAAGAAMTWDEAVAYAQRGQGPRKRPAMGWESLTPTERQVVDLVAEGLSNKEVSERLFMSVPTVKSHLTHAYAKLGFTSRAELIAAAAAR